MKRLTIAILVATLLALAALPAGAVIPNRYLGDKAKVVSATVLDVAGSVSLPVGSQGVFLVLVNDGTNDIYVTLNVTATTTTGFILKPNEEIQVPCALTSVSFVTAAGLTSLVRGWILYY